jgi:potassium-dependent mechanosensitive channel
MLPTQTRLARQMLARLASVGLLAIVILVTTASAAPLLSPDGASSARSALGSDTGAATASDTSPDIAPQIEELRKRIAATEAMLAQPAPGDAVGNSSRQLATQRDLMKYLVAVLIQRQAAVESITELKTERQERESQLKRLRALGPARPPPYSLLMLEDLRDQLAAESVRHDTIEAEVAVMRNLLELVRQTHETRERGRRSAREALERSRDPQVAGRLNAALDSAILLASVARETMHLREIQLKELEIEKSINELNREYIRERIQLVSEQVTFSQDDLQTVFQKLADTEAGLKHQMESTGAALQEIQQKWLEAKGGLDRSPGSPLAEETVKAWQLARDSRQKEMASLNQRVAEIAVLRTLWQSRYAVFNETATGEEMKEWRGQLRGFVERLGQARRLSDLDFERCRTDLAILDMRLNQARQEQPQVASWLEFQSDELKHLMGIHAKIFLEISASDVFLERFSAELDEALGIQSEGRWLAGVGAWAKSAWNYEITSVSDEPITVRKLIGTLIFLFVGWLVSRWLSRMLSRRILPRFGLDGGNAAALQSIVFYLVFVLFGYVSLELIGVPLTVFAFLGGAVAIGIGFGSQNIINNFISGLILLFERPIRVGDLVDIDGTHGTIERVGARSTRVRTGSNLEMIIPNSRFLENNVTNLTLSDERFRASVCVGVAYGSPTNRVAEVLERAVLEHPDVIKTPDPFVLFTDFAASSLNFEVHFWIRMRTLMQRRRIESDVRHAIDGLLREADITIAFPQRDIHFDASAPIEVRVQAAEMDAPDRQTLDRAA